MAQRRSRGTTARPEPPDTWVRNDWHQRINCHKRAVAEHLTTPAWRTICVSAADDAPAVCRRVLSSRRLRRRETHEYSPDKSESLACRHHAIYIFNLA